MRERDRSSWLPCVKPRAFADSSWRADTVCQPGKKKKKEGDTLWWRLRILRAENAALKAQLAEAHAPLEDCKDMCCSLGTLHRQPSCVGLSTAFVIFKRALPTNDRPQQTPAHRLAHSLVLHIPPPPIPPPATTSYHQLPPPTTTYHLPPTTTIPSGAPLGSLARAAVVLAPPSSP